MICTKTCDMHGDIDSLIFFDATQPLSVDFGLCASTRLVFFDKSTYCRSKNIQLYVLQVQGPTILFTVGPKPCYFMFCRFKDLQLYVL